MIILTILSFALRMKAWRQDFNGAYSNGKFGEEEEIYMQSLPGYATPGENSVKRLRKSLSGLKQAGRRWYDTLARALANLSFRITQADPGVFSTRIGNYSLILAVHVDDCISPSSAKLIAEYKQKLNNYYALTDLGPVHATENQNCVRLRDVHHFPIPGAYIDSILSWFALVDAKAYATPIVPGVVYSRGNSPSSPTKAARMKETPYRGEA